MAVFNNGILHSWTFDGLYYVITQDSQIYYSTNKFTSSSKRIGTLPIPDAATHVKTNPLVDYEGDGNSETIHQLTDTSGTSMGGYVIANIIVVGSNILVDYIKTSTNEVETYLSRSFGSQWSRINNIHTDTPGYISKREDIYTEEIYNQYYNDSGIWRLGLTAFIAPDFNGCNLYMFKPVFKRIDLVTGEGSTGDRLYDVVGWVVVQDNDVVICNPGVPSLDICNFEKRFSDSGLIGGSIKTDLNHMPNVDEVYRKPYTIHWPNCFTYVSHRGQNLEHKGYTVNAHDVVFYTKDKQQYLVARTPLTCYIKQGNLAYNSSDTQSPYKCGELKFNIPALYVINLSTIANATTTNKFNIRVLDPVGFDVALAPLNGAVFTKNAGVYSFINKYLGDGVDLIDMFFKPGTVYDYGDDLPASFKNSEDRISGDIVKITDPQTNKDVLGFVYRGRVKICTGNPSLEKDWIDVTTDSTYKQKQQPTVISGIDVAGTSHGIPSTGGNDGLFSFWNNWSKVLKYDYEYNRFIGHGFYNKVTKKLEYTFPAFKKTGSTYTLGYIGSTANPFNSDRLAVTKVSEFYSDALDVSDDELNDLETQPSNKDTRLYYGGFVGAKRGYIGSMTDFVDGILVPGEPEFPTEPEDPEPPTTEPALPTPVTLAIIDDVKKSSTAVIDASRLVVSFDKNKGSCIANIGLDSGKYYVELSYITSRNIYFGLAKPDFNVNAEPGDDAGVLAVNMSGEVLFGGALIFKHSAPLIDEPSVTPTAKIGIKIDLTNRKLHYTNGDGVYQSIAIGNLPKGTLHFFIGSDTEVRDPGEDASVVVNFGQHPFSYPVPGGYKSGYGIG